MSNQLSWIVGGASFGSDYGVTNVKMPSQKEVIKIVELARRFKWFGVDTAPTYGQSEKFLGKTDLKGLGVFSKLPRDCAPKSLLEAVLASCKKMNIEMLEGLTFHNPQSFIENHAGFISEVNLSKKAGYISTWGVSVYSPKEIEEVLRVARPDYFQAPVNLLDRRFLNPDLNRRMSDSGASLQARSIFLQGVLANPVDSLPKYFDAWKGMLRNAERKALDYGSDLRSHALHFVRSQNQVASVVVGVNSAHQMKQISDLIAQSDIRGYGNLLDANHDEALIDPRFWS